MTNQPTLDHFEAALLSSLREEVARRNRPAPSRRPRRLALVGSAAASIGAVVAGTFLLQPSAAYALDPQPDGDIVVTINSLKDADGLERALRDAGVEAEVDYDADLPHDLMLDDKEFGLGSGTEDGPPTAGGDAIDKEQVKVDEDTLLGDPEGPDQTEAEKHAKEYAEGAVGGGLPPEPGPCAMSIESRVGGGVTFRLPATAVDSDAVLHITTSGGGEDDWSWSAIMVQWEGGEIC